MYDMFSKYFENTNALPMPMLQSNKLFVSELEKVVTFQMNALQSYMDMGLSQLRAAAEVNDVKSLQDFLSDQNEVANTLREKVMNDAQALADLVTGFKANLDDLAKDSMTTVTSKAA